MKRSPSEIIKQLEKAQSISKIGSWDVDFKTNNAHWSKEHYALLEINDNIFGEELNKEFRSRIHPDDIEEFDRVYKTSISVGKPIHLEYRVVCKQDVIKCLLAKGEVEKNEKGEIVGACGTVQDITEQKQLQQELTDLNNKLRKAQQISKTGSWELDLRDKSLKWSKEHYRIFGIDENLGVEGRELFEAFKSKIHPDDIEHIQESTKESITRQKYIELHYRVVNEDGSITYVLGKNNTVVDNEGNSIKLTGTVQDVTEEELLKQELAHNQEKLAREAKETKLLLEERNTLLKEVQQSISYSQRIQNTIIPKIEDIRKYIPNTSYFLKARDIVSGDFPYFFYKEGYSYYAAIDCTGHGVPGAMLSMVGNLLLNEIFNSIDVIRPSEILDRLHEGMCKTLAQESSDTTLSDGMDMALCRINLETNEVIYAGANRPLYQLREKEITRYPSNRISIGDKNYTGNSLFTDQKIEVNKGDSVFMFSDGVTDQFGDVINKKFGTKRLRDSIITNSQSDIDTLVLNIKENIDKWQGTAEQTDDILFIGFQM